MREENYDENPLIKARYYGNKPETCFQIIESYLYFSGFGNLIAEHPTAECNSANKDLSKGKYDPMGCFEDWWNEYISDEEGCFVEENDND